MLPRCRKYLRRFENAVQTEQTRVVALRYGFRYNTRARPCPQGVTLRWSLIRAVLARCSDLGLASSPRHRHPPHDYALNLDIELNLQLRIVCVKRTFTEPESLHSYPFTISGLCRNRSNPSASRVTFASGFHRRTKSGTSTSPPGRVMISLSSLNE